MANSKKGEFPLKDYKKDTVVASGGAGRIVYKYVRQSEKENLPIDVAVKECILNKFSRKEVEILQIVSENPHENIIEYLGSEVNTSENSTKLVFELCDANLLTHMKENRENLDERSLINFSCQITNGINHLHNLHIAHRDIKPENVLVKNTSNGIVLKVTDFGGSRILDHLGTQSVTTCGTLVYMSPEMREAYEQILTRSHLEPMKSDIYSLGLLFTFIHGNGNARLVQAISQENARERKASDTLLETEFISSCVYNILIAMLRKQPKDRITIGEVKAYLDAKELSLKNEQIRKNPTGTKFAIPIENDDQVQYASEEDMDIIHFRAKISKRKILIMKTAATLAIVLPILIWLAFYHWSLVKSHSVSKPIPEKLTILMVVGGGSADDDVELIDLTSKGRTCRKPNNFHQATYGPVGLFFNGQAIVCGDPHYKSYKTQCYIYDNGRWVKSEIAMKVQSFAAATVINGQWWVTGGMNLYGQSIATTQVLKNTSKSFEPFVNLTKSTGYHNLVQMDENKTMLLGGSFLPEHETHIFHLANNTWSKGPTLLRGRTIGQAGLVKFPNGSSMIVAASGIYELTTEFLDMNGENTWHLGAELPYVIVLGTSVQFENTFLIVGGVSGADALDTIWMFNITTENWTLLNQKLSTARVSPAAFLVPDEFC